MERAGRIPRIFEEVQLFAAPCVIADRGVAGPKGHVADLSLAGVPKRAVGLPLIPL